MISWNPEVFSGKLEFLCMLLCTSTVGSHFELVTLMQGYKSLHFLVKTLGGPLERVVSVKD